MSLDHSRELEQSNMDSCSYECVSEEKEEFLNSVAGEIKSWITASETHMDRIKRNALSLALGALVAFLYLFVWDKLSMEMKWAPSGLEDYNTFFGILVLTGSCSLLVAVVRSHLEPKEMRIIIYRRSCLLTLVKLFFMFGAPLFIMLLAYGLGSLIHTMLFDWFPDTLFMYALLFWPAVQLLIILGSLIGWFISRKKATDKLREVAGLITESELDILKEMISD